MKDSKNDSTPVLERFARDKRKRTVIATAERVERRPRLQRDAADSEQASYSTRSGHRASYNPHFTADNRPRFEHSRREQDERPHRSYGEKPRFGEHSRFEGERPHRTFGDRENRYDNEERPHRTFGDRENRYDNEERPRRTFGDRENRYDNEERPRRASGSRGPKPSYGEKRAGKFDDRKGGKGAGKFARGTLR